MKEIFLDYNVFNGEPMRAEEYQLRLRLQRRLSAGDILRELVWRCELRSMIEEKERQRA